VKTACVTLIVQFAYASLILYELNLLYKYAVSAKSNGHRAKPFADYQVTILFRSFSKPEELIKRSIKQGNRTRILSNSDLAWCLPLKNSYNHTVLIVSIGNICNNHIIQLGKPILIHVKYIFRYVYSQH
jgi:hypothetical protein